MFKFFKEAFSELEHVVWPTPKETKKYMTYTVGVIVFAGLFLMVTGFIFRSSLLFARTETQKVWPGAQHNAMQDADNQPATQEDLQNAIKNIQATVSGSTESGAIVPTVSVSGATTDAPVINTTPPLNTPVQQ